MLAEHVYNTSKAASEVLVGSLILGTEINSVEHKAWVCRVSADGQEEQGTDKTEGSGGWGGIESPLAGNVEWGMVYGYTPLL